MKAYNLMCEYAKNPLGVEIPSPRLNWSAEPEFQGQSQEQYQIVVEEEDNGHVAWDSGRVSSRKQCAVYRGNGLKPETAYRWRAKWWDNRGNESEWSEWGHFVTGILKWQGK